MTIGVWQSEQCICMPGILDQMAVQVIKKDSPLLQKSMMANCELSRGSIMKIFSKETIISLFVLTCIVFLVKSYKRIEK